MKRIKEYVQERKEYLIAYFIKNRNKQIKVVVAELSDYLFLSEQSVFAIIKECVILIPEHMSSKYFRII